MNHPDHHIDRGEPTDITDTVRALPSITYRQTPPTVTEYPFPATTSPMFPTLSLNMHGNSHGDRKT